MSKDLKDFLYYRYLFIGACKSKYMYKDQNNNLCFNIHD